MQTLKELVLNIVEAPGWTRKKLAKHLGTSYVTVCRWTAGEVTETSHANIEELTRLYMEICKNDTGEWGEESGDYQVPEGQTATVYHTGTITIVNHGIVRVITRDNVEEDSN